MENHALREGRALPRLQQIEGPRDHTSEHRPATGRLCGPQVARQTFEQLCRTQHPTARRREFDRLRHALEVTSDLIDRCELGAIGGANVGAAGLVGAFDEQERGFADVVRTSFTLIAASAHAQRRHGKCLHTRGRRHRVTAGGEDMQARTQGDKGDEGRDGVRDGGERASADCRNRR